MNATGQRIAEAFERHVVSHGYDKANLDDVARELKISKKTIYVHFDGKRDIYAHVVARQAQRRRPSSRPRWLRCRPMPRGWRRSCTSLLDVARAHITKTGEDEWLREYEIAADAFRKANGDLLRELVQGGMDAGEFRSGDASLVEKMIAAMIVEYLLLVNADPSYDRDTELLERIVGFVG